MQELSSDDNYWIGKLWIQYHYVISSQEISNRTLASKDQLTNTYMNSRVALEPLDALHFLTQLPVLAFMTAH